MADKVGEMAVSGHPTATPHPFFSFFQNLLKNLPLPKFEVKQGVVDGEQQHGELQAEGETILPQKPDVVRFSEIRPAIPPPLKLEAEESESNSSPAVLWQVYALGGFIILRWAWARWNERKKKNGGSNEEPSRAED